MKEVRIHGRGGQGSVTAAELLAVAAFEDGKYSQAFPFFGVERRGAPVTAFTRLSDKKIRLRSQIYEPDYVIVQDATLIAAVDVTAGIKPDGIVIVNSEKTAEQVGLDAGIDVRTIDATAIALEIIGRPIVNTTLLGAFAGATGEIGIESIKQSVLARFPGKVGEVNVQAAEKAYQLMTAMKRKPRKKTTARRKSESREKSEKLPIGAIGRPGTSEVTRTGDWRVFYPEFDIEQCTRWCTGCGTCVENCPDAAIRERVLSGPDVEEAPKRAAELESAGKIKKAAVKKAHVQYDVQYELYLMYCKGCGICANECPVQGIKMKLEEK